MGQPHSEPVVQSESLMILKGSLKLKAWSSACDTPGKWTFRRWGLMESHYGCDVEGILETWPLLCLLLSDFQTVSRPSGPLLLSWWSVLSWPKAQSDWTESVNQIFFLKKSFLFRVQGQKMPKTGCLGSRLSFRPVQWHCVDKFLYFHTAASSRVKRGDCHRRRLSQLWGSANV